MLLSCSQYHTTVVGNLTIVSLRTHTPTSTERPVTRSAAASDTETKLPTTDNMGGVAWLMLPFTLVNVHIDTLNDISILLFCEKIKQKTHTNQHHCI